MKVAIINDTSGPHVGCQLVAETFREQLDRVGVELVGCVHKSIKKLDAYPDFVKRADLLIVNGEGSIHHGARLELIELAARFPAILINCVFEQVPPLPALHKFKLVTARESLSASAMRAQGVAAEMMPDIIITSRRLASFRRGPIVDDIGITDSVLDETSGLLIKTGEGHVDDYLAALSRHRRICSGRFHSALMAAVLGIPFSAWASNTHKIKGLLIDMGIPELYADRREDALAIVPAEFPPSVLRYIEAGRAKVNGLFDRLHTFA